MEGADPSREADLEQPGPGTAGMRRRLAAQRPDDVVGEARCRRPPPPHEAPGVGMHELRVEAHEVAPRPGLDEAHLGRPHGRRQRRVQRDRLVHHVGPDLVGQAGRVRRVRAAKLEGTSAGEALGESQIVEQARHVQRLGIRRESQVAARGHREGPGALTVAEQGFVVGLAGERPGPRHERGVGHRPHVGVERSGSPHARALGREAEPLPELEESEARGDTEAGAGGQGGSHARSIARGTGVGYAAVSTIPAIGSRAVRPVHVWLRPELQLLDITGPAEVLSTASRVATFHGRADGYAIELCAPGGEPVRTAAGVTLHADADTAGLLERATADATLLVPGAFADGDLPASDDLLDAIARFPGRVVSICAGAFQLARAGRLDGRRATTHWLFTGRLAEGFPGVDVEPDALWVRDREVWTSAGVSAGIDLSLALVEADLGRTVALEVARLLVLHLKRPGGQSQFSSVLEAQRSEESPLGELLVWMHDHPDADLRVPALARRVGMSPRHFARVFVRHTGRTPAALVRTLRLATARRMLEDDGRSSLAQIAERSGHGSVESLRRAFVRSLGVSPGAYRDRFTATTPPREPRG